METTSNSSNQRSTCTFDITAETLRFYSNNHQIRVNMSSEASTSNAIQQTRRDNEHLVISDDPEHPANLIPELCRGFYQLGWVTGTGGGISIRHSTSDQNLVYLAPSGVQKERITPLDLFVLPYDQPTVPRAGTKRTTLREPKKQGLKESACTPLFWNAFRLRDAGACIHTHSQHAVMLTLLLPRTAKSFKISHMEMIKGMRLAGTGKALAYFDTLEIPIIENTADEEDLTGGMEAAMNEYPESGVVLVRQHGSYNWGKTWEQAKTQAECADYLFEMAVKMIQAGIPLVGEDKTPSKPFF
ncbi:cytoplasm protein [Filobasidium floriforme]|uniref:cytoplasm protein n=1 Tax=Filobasidium floriforme TaxID=5210 RepID=UPI001E8D982F|nr:cytoplasm protein [Filobasidium floriforme]KAH8090880.1 cytoplasm protein [Filobasidium floriforme]